jgi:hypothetical protein
MAKRNVIIVLVAGTLSLVGAAQLFRPTLKNPPYEPLLVGSSVTKDVNGIFERACKDCHSNNTDWPWYARTAPASWIVSHDVARGRVFMNLSRWQHYDHARKMGFLAGMAAATTNREMPPRMYTVLHEDARLSDQERVLIAGWARKEYNRIRTQQP